MSEYFLKPNSLGANVKVELDLSNYATKTDLKNVTGVDTSSFAKKTDLSNLKSDVDKLDIDKLKNIPTNLSNLKNKVDKLDVDEVIPVLVNLSKLSDIVKSDVVKKDVYNAKIKNIEDKIPDITNLTTNAFLNTKINKIENEIPNINNLVTTTAITAIGNKIPNVSDFVKKTDYNTKISDIKNKITGDHNHDKYITTQEFNKLTSENFAVRLEQANLASKNDIAALFKRHILMKKLLQVKQNMYLLKMNLKNYRYLTQVFLLVKVTLIMIDHNFT